MAPEQLSYSRNHEWCRLDGEIATVGVTPHALKGLGNLVAIELPDEGDDVLYEVPVAEIEGTRDSREVYSLVDGVVSEVNGAVAHNPELLVTDPYEKGWLVRVKFLPESHRAEMLSASEYQEMVRRSR